MRIVKDYLVKIGHRTAAEMKTGLGLRSLREFRPRYGEEFAYYLSAAVVNRVFSERAREPDAARFVEEHADLVDKEARILSSDDPLCQLLTSSVYSLSYARHIEGGGKTGFFSNPYIGYIRAVGRSFHDPSYIEISTDLACKLETSVIEPVWTLLHLGLFRPLPHNPDSKQIYERVHEFAVREGVAFK